MKEAKGKKKKKKEGTLGNNGRGGASSEGDATPPKDRNASGERYLAPPDGRIRKLVSGISLYGETPRLEGREARVGYGREIEGGGFATLPYCDIVYTIVQLRARERETRRERHAAWMHREQAGVTEERVRTLKGLREWARRWQG